MKKYLFIAFLLFSFSLLCCNSSPDDSSDNQDENTSSNTVIPNTNGNTNTNNSKENEENNDDIASVSVTFVNNSSYSVNVFKNIHRQLGGSALLAVSAKESSNIDLPLSSEKNGDTFYFEYNIPIGTIEFPYFCYENSKVFIISSEKTNTIIIDEIKSCPTKSAYIVLENQSTSQIYLVNGNSILTPVQQDSYFVDIDSNAVYLAGQNNESIYYETSSFLKIQIGAKQISLPELTFSIGSIYTFTISNDLCSLKAITPFNIDTKKQMWSFSDNSTFDNTFPIILRERKNISDGCLIMGTLANDNTAIGLKKIDKYNSKNSLLTAKITHDASSNIKQSKVLDFVEQSDGSIVLLLQNTFASSNGLEERTFIVCYDFSNKQIKWSHIFSDISKMMFRADSKNKLLCTTDGTIALAGSVITDDKMKRYFAVLDANGQLKSWTSSDFTDISSGIETMFTSAWYDGTDYYVCGYDNCDFQYSSRTHKGIIYKFSSDLESVEKIYEQDNTLFLCIDGIKGSEEKWYVCGEYLDSGKILKGCYLSSSLVKANSEPIKYATYSANKPYCYFTQICCYKNKIILGGEASDDFAGNNAIPLIVAFDCDSDKTMFENTSFSQYNKLGSIIPNEINTYIVQLLSSSDVHYVSADLLGNE